MVTDPTTLAVYAALAENVYRRDSSYDQALSIADIDAITSLDLIVQAPDPQNLIAVTDADGNTLGDLQTHGNYYYSDRGFGGMIVEIGGKYVVVLRGTDTTLSGYSAVWEAALGDGTPPDGSDGSIMDIGDADTNQKLGQGSYDATQWDDTRALVDRAIVLAGNNPDKNSRGSVFN